MIRRIMAMFIGGLGAALASQAPEFAQQYAQRLGGAVEELRGIVQQFDRDGARSNLDRQGGLKRLEGSSDTFIVARGQAMRATIQRFTLLEAQKQSMNAPDVLTRVGAMVKDYDPLIAQQAKADFRPALPLTLEGLFFALLGFLGGTSIGAIIALPMGRRKLRPSRNYP